MNGLNISILLSLNLNNGSRYYLTSPVMKLEMHNAVNKGRRIVIVAVPSHLYHITFELLKVSFHEVFNNLPGRVVFTN